MKRWVILAAGLPVLTAVAAVGVLWRAIDSILPTDPFDVFEDNRDAWDEYATGGIIPAAEFANNNDLASAEPILTPQQWQRIVGVFGAHPTEPPRLDAFAVTEGEQVLNAQQWRERPAP